MSKKIQQLLDQQYKQQHHKNFIASDPISVPHRFNKKQDIEISGLFAAVFAWGIRKTIINKANELMHLMDDAPYDFCLHHKETDLKKMLAFVHRTFNATDLLYFIHFLNLHYQKDASLESAFFKNQITQEPIINVEDGLNHFYQYFTSLEDFPSRTKKHIAHPLANSSCKRLNMYLRWMVRKDDQGIDFGIWETIQPADLICPLDVHVVRVANNLGILQTDKVNWHTAQQLTAYLKQLDSRDPVKYDFALFGMGVNKELL
jgi:uncharacterized protein (TIGR02757 family)